MHFNVKRTFKRFSGRIVAYLKGTLVISFEEHSEQRGDKEKPHFICAHNSYRASSKTSLPQR